MADEHNPNDPQWDWLYDGGQGDPDHTAMLPQGGRPTPAPARQGQPAASGDPEAPQQPPDRVTSFGGTYPRPGGTAPPPYSPQAQAAPSYGSPVTRPAPPTRPPAGTGRPAIPVAPPPAPRPRRRVRWLRIAVAVLAAWLLFLVITPIYAWSKVSKVDAEPPGNRPEAGPGSTYLLVGSDSREGLTPQQEHDLGTGAAAGQRTDTIIMLHVSDSDGPNVMLSIPRDSYVEIPGHGMAKINAAYAYGGPKLLVRTVEQATGVRIDNYIEIGFTGVVDIVDAVGGITVCPKTSIDDPKAGGLQMERGCQQVDGHTALDYSRSRKFPLGDITRTQHQREVIAATGSAAASWQTVVLPWRYWRVTMAGASSVRVGENVGPFDFARFAWAMAHSSGPGTLRCVVPFSSLGTSTPVGSVVTWDRPKAEAIFRDISNDETSSIACKAG